MTEEERCRELLRECLKALNAVASFGYGDGEASYDLARKIEMHLNEDEGEHD